MFKKGDIILTAALVLAALLLGGFLLFGQEQGQTAEVRINGEIYGTYMLDKAQTVTVDRGDVHFVLEIKDGSVRMLSAHCPDQLCVLQGAISKAGQSIVCLPQRVVVEIKGKNKDTDIIIK